MIVVGILTSYDLPRLRRAIQSVRNQRAECAYFVEINTKDKEYRKAVQDYCEAEQIVCYSSASNGTPGKGKQAVFNRFLKEMKDDHLLLLDGDDWLYPVAIESLERTLQELSPVDVLISCAVDQIDADIESGERIVAVNGDDHYPEVSDPLGRVQSKWLYEGSEALVPGRPTFFSRRAVQALSWDCNLPCYEDGLFILETILAHQKGQLHAIVSRSQDLMVYDRETPGSMQKQVDFTDCTTQLRTAVERVGIPKDATSMGQLPAICPRQFLSVKEKHAFIESTWNTTPRMDRGNQQDTPQYVFLRRAFSIERMNNLIRYAEDQGFSQAVYVDGSPRDNVKTVYLDRREHPAAADFFLDVERIARQAAPQLDIDVWPEQIDMVQIARYLPGDHYGEHVDHDNSGNHLQAHRKLTIFGAASPNGALEVEKEVVPCSTGDVIVMPSISFHAAPVQQEGTRYSFVVWVPGPQWR